MSEGQKEIGKENVSLHGELYMMLMTDLLEGGELCKGWLCGLKIALSPCSNLWRWLRTCV